MIDKHDVAVLLGFFFGLQSPCASDPNVRFANRSYGSRLNEFHHAAIV